MSALWIEYLSGPFDGARRQLDGETRWGRTAAGPLAAPWDEGLAEMQAVFRPRGGGWEIEPAATEPTLHLLRDAGDRPRVVEARAVQDGDIVYASATWLRVSIVP